MKMTVTLTGPFEGSDPGVAEVRTMTIGELDAFDLPRSVGAWAHDTTARMCRLTVDSVPRQEAIWHEIDGQGGDE